MERITPTDQHTSNTALATEGLVVVNQVAELTAAPNEPVTTARINELNQILMKYRDGKSRLDKRVRQNERWWRMRNEELEEEAGGIQTDYATKSAWLHSAIVNKHADAVEAYPEPHFLAREETDAAQAKILSKIVPVILTANDYEETYDNGWWRKLYTGGRCTKVIWDSQKLNGLGDISIVDVPVLNLFWQPGITNIQDSRYVFEVTPMLREVVEDEYPDTKGKLKGGARLNVDYDTEDNKQDSEFTLMVECYYRRTVNGKKILHYIKYVDEILLYATENDPALAQTGLYDHGLYPYDIDPLYECEGTPWGLSMVDINKSTQTAIDRLESAVVLNSVVGAVPRWTVSNSSGVNEDEIKNLNNLVIHVNSQTGDQYLKSVSAPQLSGNAISMLTNLVTELRETSGYTESSAGSTSSVTAAAGIAALQEAAGKTSRDSSRSAYRSYRRVINMVVETMRQFYTLPRYFRVMGDNGVEEYIKWEASAIAMQEQMGLDGTTYYRLPVFDIDVRAAKEAAYSRLSQNELALELFARGLFNPQIADQAVIALRMMNFEGKDDVLSQIATNGMLAQKLAQMQQLAFGLAQAHDPELAQAMAAQMGQPMPTAAPGNRAQIKGEEAEESRITAKARERSAAASQPE